MTKSRAIPYYLPFIMIELGLINVFNANIVCVSLSIRRALEGLYNSGVFFIQQNDRDMAQMLWLVIDFNRWTFSITHYLCSLGPIPP
jgi:hypothetical protein